MTELLHALLLLMLRLGSPARTGESRPNTVAARPADGSREVEKPALAANELFAERHFERALPLAEEAADRAWQAYGADDYHTIAAEEFVAHLAALSKDFDKARTIRQETDRKLERLGDPAVTEKVRLTRLEDYRESADFEKW
jgi:hypothetical protein